MFSHIVFQTITVTDVDRALTFYRDVMDFSVERDEPYGDSRWIFLKPDGGQTMLHFNLQDAVPASKTPVLVLATEDVDAAYARLKAAGANLVNAPDEAPWAPGTRWAMIRDSEGNLILLETV